MLGSDVRIVQNVVDPAALLISVVTGTMGRTWGAFNRNLNNAPSNANDNVGSRLFRAAEIFFSVALTVRKARLGLNMQRVESDRNAPTRNKQNEKKIK